jgi:hypothetical protein
MSLHDSSWLSVVPVKFHGNPMNVYRKKRNGNQSGQKQPVVIVIAKKQSNAMECRTGIRGLQRKEKFAIDEES